MSIDLHCHVLPGIDDGPGSLGIATSIARRAADLGIRTIVATPHVSWKYENSASTIRALVDRLNQSLATERVDVAVLSGAEIAATYVSKLEQDEIAALSLGGGGWILLEPPFTAAAAGFDSIAIDLMRHGHGIVLAHPERCPAFQRDPAMLARLVSAGALTSITAGAFVGRFGRHVRQFAMRLVEEDMVHNVASDAHDLTGRAPGIFAEMKRSGLEDLGQWLTESVPAAILAGEHIPARPPRAMRSRRRSRGLLDALRGK